MKNAKSAAPKPVSLARFVPEGQRAKGPLDQRAPVLLDSKKEVERATRYERGAGARP
jgi:hypothetical protein